MFLTYEDLSKVFPDVKGVREHNLDFHTVSFSAKDIQPRGLFIPLLPTSGSLQTAIANGAIAALWEKGRDIPKYTPNQFPIFLVDDILQGVIEMLIQYKKCLKKEVNEKKDETNFLFLEEKLLNDFYETYDSAVMEAHLKQMLDGI